MTRKDRLLPGGEPKYVRCYDLGDDCKCADRFTVVFSHAQSFYTRGWHPYLAMSADPYHPQGVGLHEEVETLPIDTGWVTARNGKRRLAWPPAIGRKCHLGRRIPFLQLPEACQKLVLETYCDYWEIPEASR